MNKPTPSNIFSDQCGDPKGARTICVIHPFDPRGQKIGGIESHVRELIRSIPLDLKIMLIGIDELGDLQCGSLQVAYFGTRPFEFIPLLRCLNKEHHSAATKLHRSLTLRFFVAFIANFFRIKAVLSSRSCTLEIQRFEFSIFSKLLNLKSVQIVHGEGSPDQPMDSLLKKYWFFHQLSEFISMCVSARVLGVNSNIVARLKHRFRWRSQDIGRLTVSVNSEIFAGNPHLPPLNTLKVVFAGRLDAFKRPDLMFKAIHLLRSHYKIPVEFHYIGSSDPHKFEEFAPIEEIAVLHGFCCAETIAAIFGKIHVGLLLSEFEGMPVFALELMAVGRPLVALGLPQLRSIIVDGVSGYMVARDRDDETNVSRVAAALAKLFSELPKGHFQPDTIRSLIMPYTEQTQMKRLFAIHRHLQGVATERQGDLLLT